MIIVNSVKSSLYKIGFIVLIAFGLLHVQSSQLFADPGYLNCENEREAARDALGALKQASKLYEDTLNTYVSCEENHLYNCFTTASGVGALMEVRNLKIITQEIKDLLTPPITLSKLQSAFSKYTQKTNIWWNFIGFAVTFGNCANNTAPCSSQATDLALAKTTIEDENDDVDDAMEALRECLNDNGVSV